MEISPVSALRIMMIDQQYQKQADQKHESWSAANAPQSPIQVFVVPSHTRHNYTGFGLNLKRESKAIVYLIRSSPSTFGHSWDSHPPPDSHLILIWIFNLENWICLYFSSRICKYIQRFFCHSAKTQAQGRMVSLNQENAASDLNLDIVLPYFLPLFTLKGFVCSISFMGFT